MTMQGYSSSELEELLAGGESDLVEFQAGLEEQGP